MVITPITYFIVKGSGESDISEKASFDAALIDAGIADYNWVPVSSILPPGARLDTRKKMPPKGSVMFCVLSTATVRAGEFVTVGIGVSTTHDKNGSAAVGFVMEDQEYGDKREFVEAKISKALHFMADKRNLILNDIEIVTLTFSPVSKFGTAVAVVVFNDYAIQSF